MAFATTNVRSESNGSQRTLRGNWTATLGDAAGTLDIGSGSVDARFWDNTTTGPYQPGGVPVSTSTTSGITTVTVYHQTTVTAGEFAVNFK